MKFAKNQFGRLGLSTMAALLALLIFSTVLVFAQDPISITKTVIGKTGPGTGTGSMGTVGLPGGDVVTYTIVVANNSNDTAADLFITDTIPAAVTFESWVITGSANLPVGNPITWGPYGLAAGDAVTMSFRAVVTTNGSYAGKTITNTASFSADGGKYHGSAEAAFTIKVYTIYLPVVMKN